jgi:hypothetical protein
MTKSVAGNRWCCELFKDAIEHYGERGIAIATGYDAKFGIHFALDFRAVKSSDEATFKNNGPVPFSLRMSQCIRFCPWCGAALRDFYADKAADLPLQDILDLNTSAKS